MEEPYGKAIEEVAKTTGTAIEAARSAGGFLSKYVEGPATQISEILSDKLKFYRAEQFLRLGTRLQRELDARGAHLKIRRLPLSFTIEVVEQALMEEDDILQDLWARLLVNAVDLDSGGGPKRAYVSIVKDLSPFDAAVLEKIYSVDQSNDGYAIVTHELPDRAYPAVGVDIKALPKPAEEVKLALANLERLGLIVYGVSWGGGEVFDLIGKSTTGRDFMRAIKRGDV